jgi:hypothetical protein
VVTVHGPANLSLYDQATWDKYQLAKLTGGKFATNTMIAPAAPAPPEPDLTPGAIPAAEATIPGLMRHGAVFMACHNAIWEVAAMLLRAGVNPDRLSHPALAAELTNHVIPGAILIPGAVGTLPELQHAGFHYAVAP